MSASANSDLLKTNSGDATVSQSYNWNSIKDFDHVRRCLNEYKIVYAQFCHQNMRGGLLTRTAVTAVKAGILIPTLAASTLLPSGHHRYIRFKAILFKSFIWGIIERIDEGPSVFFFFTEVGSKRPYAKLTKNGPFGDPIQMTVSPPVLLGDLYVNIGEHKSDYNLLMNNCIHYSLEVWTRLGGEMSCTDVCGGHACIRHHAKPDPEKD